MNYLLNRKDQRNMTYKKETLNHLSANMFLAKSTGSSIPHSLHNVHTLHIFGMVAEKCDRTCQHSNN